MKTRRVDLAKEGALKLLQMSTGSEQDQEKFEKFAMSLYCNLEEVATPSRNRKVSTQKMKLWKSFHSARLGEVRALWKDIFAGIEGDKYTHDPLLWEYVNERLFEEQIKVKFQVEQNDVEVPEYPVMTSMPLGMLVDM